MMWHDLTPIGLDIGTSSIKAVQARLTGSRAGSGVRGRVGSSPTICAVAHFDRIEPGPDLHERDIERIQRVLLRRGFRGRRVVAAAPEHALMMSSVELPPRASGAPLEKLARLELARAHSTPPDEIEVGMWDLPAPNRGGSGSHVMTVGTRHADADAFLQTLDAAGLDTIALEPRASAIARCARPTDHTPSFGPSTSLQQDASASSHADQPRSAGGITVLIDLGAAAAGISVIVDTVLVYSHHDTDSGIRALHHALSQRLGVTPEDANLLLRRVPPKTSSDHPHPHAGHERLRHAVSQVIQEHARRIASLASTALDYARYRYASVAGSNAGDDVNEEVGGGERIRLYGGGAAILGLPEAIADALDLDTDIMRPFDCLTTRLPTPAPTIRTHSTTIHVTSGARTQPSESLHPALVVAAALARHPAGDAP